MLSGLEARGAAIGAAAQARAIADGVERLREALPGIGVSAEADAIVLSGRGLVRRSIDDARLRWIGSLLR